MRCIGCGSQTVAERPERTAQGYKRFRCHTCGKQFNERTGTLLNQAQYPSDVIALRAALRGDPLAPIGAGGFEIHRLLPHGHVLAALGLARHIGLDELLRRCQVEG